MANIEKAKKQRKRKAAIAAFKASLAVARASRTQRPSRVVDVPYDDVFEQGVAWLDSLAGEPIEQQNGVRRRKRLTSP